MSTETAGSMRRGLFALMRWRKPPEVKSTATWWSCTIAPFTVVRIVVSASMPLQALWTWRDAKIRQCVRGHSGEGGGVAVEYTGVYWGFEREAAVAGSSSRGVSRGV